MTLATFNIELFPRARTDTGRVALRLAETGADIIAVQEIRDHAALQRVVDRITEDFGREYGLILSNCGGDGEAITTGILFDKSHWSLVAARQFPGFEPEGRGSCWSGSQAATLAVVERTDGMRVAALSVHMAPHPARFPERKVQWRKLLDIMSAVEREFEARAVALGDFNSTGFSAEPVEERRFVDDIVEQAGFELVTRTIPCTEYWRPHAKEFQPSVLDHIVVREGSWDEPEALGMCEALRCQTVGAEDMHEDFNQVSDHCPVRVRGRW